MGNKIKAIIFDWGGTLHNPKTDSLFSGVPEMLKNLSKDYILILVSLARSESPKERKKKIADSGIAKYFKTVLVGDEDKDKMYEHVLADLKITPRDVVVVDDRVVRGIAWGNKKGTTTIWIKNGKYAAELPSAKTGKPNFTIESIAEIEGIVSLVSCR